MRRRLAENDLKPWRKDMWCIPKVDAAYVACMEDVLDLYAEPCDPRRPVICFDESPTQRRTAVDFAACMGELTDIHFPEAEQTRVVLDNLSTHSPAALYSAFPPAEARRVLRRLEFHYTPKHASWLNMVEIEIGVLRSQCLDRRIPTREKLTSEIAAWEQQRNDNGARIKWMFTTDHARSKMPRAYPEPTTGITAQAKES